MRRIRYFITKAALMTLLFSFNLAAAPDSVLMTTLREAAQQLQCAANAATEECQRLEHRLLELQQQLCEQEAVCARQRDEFSRECERNRQQWQEQFSRECDACRQKWKGEFDGECNTHRQRWQEKCQQEEQGWRSQCERRNQEWDGERKKREEEYERHFEEDAGRWNQQYSERFSYDVKDQFRSRHLQQRFMYNMNRYLSEQLQGTPAAQLQRIQIVVLDETNTVVTLRFEVNNRNVMQGTVQVNLDRWGNFDGQAISSVVQALRVIFTPPPPPVRPLQPPFGGGGGMGTGGWGGGGAYPNPGYGGVPGGFQPDNGRRPDRWDPPSGGRGPGRR